MWESVVCLCGSHPQASHQSPHLPPLSPQSILIGYLKCQHATLQQHIKKSTVSNKHSIQTTVQGMFSSGQTITMQQNPQTKILNISLATLSNSGKKTHAIISDLALL